MIQVVLANRPRVFHINVDMIATVESHPEGSVVSLSSGTHYVVKSHPHEITEMIMKARHNRVKIGQT